MTDDHDHQAAPPFLANAMHTAAVMANARKHRNPATAGQKEIRRYRVTGEPEMPSAPMTNPVAAAGIASQPDGHLRIVNLATFGGEDGAAVRIDLVSPADPARDATLVGVAVCQAGRWAGILIDNAAALAIATQLTCAAERTTP